MAEGWRDGVVRMTDKPKALIHSNAPWSPSGYGNQTALFAPLLHKAGWDVIISAFYGLKGGILNTDYARILPGGGDAWGNDVLPFHYREHKPDVLFNLHDIWVLQPDVLDQMPVASWCPVDHQPIPPQSLAALKHVRWPVAMSKFGERMMREAGLDPLYIPHGVDTTVFKPGDRAAAREKWHFKPEQFVVVAVAANKGFPSRKSLDRILKAWARFVADRPDAVLYIHTSPGGGEGGAPNLFSIAEFHGVNTESLLFPDSYRLAMGQYPPLAMVNLYNAADVMLLPSMGEGFGIPVIEAQACGCPVIVTDFSAQPELVRGGYAIPVDPFDDLVWTWQSSEQADIKPSKIVTALEWAYDQRGNATVRQQAAEGMQEYDAQHVFDTYMHPAFKLIAATNAVERDNYAATDEKPTPGKNGTSDVTEKAAVSA